MAQDGETPPGMNFWEPRITSWSITAKTDAWSTAFACPGGTVVAATSEEGTQTNGMSQYSRKERNANAHCRWHNPGARLSGRRVGRHRFSKALGSCCLQGRGRKLQGPGSKGRRFSGRESLHFIGSVTPSYTPGINLTDLSACIPDYAVEAIRKPFRLSIERSRDTP